MNSTFLTNKLLCYERALDSLYIKITLMLAFVQGIISSSACYYHYASLSTCKCNYTLIFTVIEEEPASHAYLIGGVSMQADPSYLAAKNGP